MRKVLLRPPLQFWVEITCARCEEQLAGCWVTSVIPRTALEKEARHRGGVRSGSRYFCSEACRLEE